MKEEKEEIAREKHKETPELPLDDCGAIAEDTASEGVEKEDVEEIVAKLNDKYLRLAAEFDNYRRRSLKERHELILTAGEGIITGILPILDDLSRAIGMLKGMEGDNTAAIEGTTLIQHKLLTYLSSRGLKEIEAMGKPLDTDLHEAVAQIPASKKSLKRKIVEVIQPGYVLNGKVIRYAKVVVGM